MLHSFESFLSVLFLAFLCLATYVQCLPNKRFHISTICSNEKFSASSLPKLIDGAVITSSREENLNCVITFTTESVLQRFMLRFEDLKLDCNDNLQIYDGDIAVGNPKVNLSCRSTRNEVGTIFINGYFVTLKYVTDPFSKQGDGFSLVITAYKDTSPSNCNLYTCANTYCISPELTCDNINHCGDNSDEASQAQCPVIETDNSVIFGLEASAFLGLVFILFLVCLLCVISVGLCLFRSDGYRATQQSRISLLQGTPIHLAHPYAGATIVTNAANQRFATLPLEKLREKPPPYVQIPGNPPMVNTNLSMSTLNNLNAQNNIIPVQHVVYYAGK